MVTTSLVPQMVFEATPKRWLSYDYTVRDDGEPIADIDVSWWREQGTLEIDGVPHRVYREGVMSGAFVLEREGETLARARKPSALSRRIMIEFDGSEFTLQPRHALGRAFRLLNDGQIVGVLAPARALSRRMNVEFWAAMPRAVAIFVIWLTVILWKRDDQAGAT